MKKALLSLSCGLFSVLNLSGAYATEGGAPQGAFNPPRDISLVEMEQMAAEQDSQKTLEKEKSYQKQLQQVATDVNGAISKCKENYDAQTVKSYTQLVSCYNPAIMAIYQRADYPYMDLMQSLNDKRLELGNEIDKNVISEAQAEYELSQFYAGIKEEERKRNNALTKSSLVSENN